MMSFRFFLSISMFPLSSCVLPTYTPPLMPTVNGGRPVDEVIRTYFIQGYENAEILGFLALLHGVVIGMRTLKRWLNKMGLRRPHQRNEDAFEDIVSAILSEMDGCVGSFAGYREMTRRLKCKHNLHVRRDTVMRALRVIDPNGVQNRKRRRLQRRKYSTPGPNFVWHVDGWDKLRPYGFYVHGCVDGFSRRILWLEVGSTNKNPNVVLNFFLDTVLQLGGVPRLVRTDKGTENIWISAIQQLLRMDDQDSLAGANSFIEGKSSANQRIEAYWSKLRSGGGGWWINFFKDLRDSGIFLDHDALHIECIKFCFMPVLRKELHSVAQMWNIKNIQTKKDADVFGGKPDVMFFLPESYSASNYMLEVNKDDVNLCKTLYGEESRDYSVEFEELVQILIPNFTVPKNTQEGLRLYLQIIDSLKQMGC